MKQILGVDRPNDVVVSASYVYVTRSSSLEVFDAKTGACSVSTATNERVACR
jgi:hypothetical protein